ncbi:hypothetical protein KKF82_06365 [Patescibacteria group bacterium]|nr:hypothetical protein [Patescibacteria group bacterium]
MKAKEVKRTEAEERQVLYDVLTPKQRISKLNKGKFRATKERRRLGFPEIPQDCIR